ncbi:cysteine desulfurase family protein [Methyloceanibacter caenitepidi]|uniref:Cysteine desulfurase n=1 Tax=Methyloceanibacter caenitepidi TaxID=1384459 RepID=A0A0A8K2R3_9HYPH|nr:cysteine desulfurase family protein [Methyloceanibacter caenitepidi]BAQ17205.1 cysteine desulfurase [Methyloceanibacter caenitepidi]
MNQRAYLDHNATAPLRPEVREAMSDALALVGNPSSVHAEGRAARAAVEEARVKVAALVHARPEDVIFTSGGTEANALALAPPAGGGAWKAFISSIEHPSVLAGGRFGAGARTVLPVTSAGLVDLESLARTLAEEVPEGSRPFVSLMAANNETGAVQPVAEAAAVVHEAGGVLHTDAVQVAGRLPLDMSALGADLLTLSAHKIGGPKGVGAVVMAEGASVQPLMTGGGQESRRRPGTENVAGIVGFGVAADLAAKELPAMGDVARLRDALEEGVRTIAPDAVVFAHSVARLPNTSLIAVPGLKAETLVIGLDLAGVSVSAGSACSSGKVETSHVLTAMGAAPEAARAAIRVSLGFRSCDNDIQSFLGAFGDLVKRLRKDEKAAA